MNVQITIQEAEYIRSYEEYTLLDGDVDVENTSTYVATERAPIVVNSYAEAQEFVKSDSGIHLGGPTHMVGNKEMGYLVSVGGRHVMNIALIEEDYFNKWLIRMNLVDVTFDLILDSYGFENSVFEKGVGYKATYKGFQVTVSKVGLGFMALVTADGFKIEAKKAVATSIVGSIGRVRDFLSNTVANINCNQLIILPNETV